MTLGCLLVASPSTTALRQGHLHRMRSLSLMPSFRSFLRFCLVWLLRAVAMRCCQCWISLAVCSINAVDARPLSHHERTSTPTAVWTWQTVRSGFFPPQLFTNSGQEQVAHAGENQVSLQTEPATALPLIESDFLLLILKTPLDTPTRKPHQQKRLHRGLWRGVADEKLHFVEVQHIASHH